MAETYKITIRCINCGHIPIGEFGPKIFTIVKGLIVDEYFKNKECENCGCKDCLVGRE